MTTFTPCWRVECGHVLDVLRGLPADSVQCVVTSPPYLWLRDYGTPPQVWGGDPACPHVWEAAPRSGAHRRGNRPGDLSTSSLTNPERQDTVPRPRDAGAFCAACGAWLGSLGLEPTPDLFVEHLVEVFREVRRVLRPDGVVWLNLSDCHYGAAHSNDQTMFTGRRRVAGLPDIRGTRRALGALKRKGLVLVPARVALALQADGWYVRSDIIWSKPNPMPESVTDRPSRSHEYLFLLSRRERYFYDADAIREPHQSQEAPRYGAEAQYLAPGQKPQQGLHRRPRGAGVPPARNKTVALRHHGDRRAAPEPGEDGAFHPLGRNARTVWSIPTQPSPEQHFATFPRALVERCLLAGTSPIACPHCRAPWGRVVATAVSGPVWRQRGPRTAAHLRGDLVQGGGRFAVRYELERLTVAWRPTCDCRDNDGAARCLVLDPFSGAGTVGVVAARLGRDVVLCDLNPGYCAIARRRVYPEAQPRLDLRGTGGG